MFVNVSSGYFHKWLDNVFLNCPCYELTKSALGVALQEKPSPSHRIYVTAKLSEPQDRTAVEAYYSVLLFYKNMSPSQINQVYFPNI